MLIDDMTRLINLKRRYILSLKFTYFIFLKFSFAVFAFNSFLRSKIFSTRLLIKARYFLRKYRNRSISFYYSLNIEINFFNYYIIKIKCYLLK